MSVTRISAELRRVVSARSEGVCEYCLIAEEDTFFGCEIDHVISEKHGGPTEVGNLALACVFCNQAKGSDVGSVHPESGDFIRFFNPRSDSWADYFEIVGDRIEPMSVIGDVTARILGFNSAERRLERRTLQAMGRYPPAAAQLRLRS